MPIMSGVSPTAMGIISSIPDDTYVPIFINQKSAEAEINAFYLLLQRSDPQKLPQYFPT